jgi:hypothetical protein
VTNDEARFAQLTGRARLVARRLPHSIVMGENETRTGELRQDPRDVAALVRKIEQDFLKWIQGQNDKYGIDSDHIRRQ